MEHKSSDKIAKSILSNSKLSIDNPDFSKTIVNTIQRENRKRILIGNLKYYSLIFIGIDILIVTLLSLFDTKITDILAKTSIIFTDLASGQLVLIYFTLIIAAILLIKSSSGIGYSYFKDQQLTR